MYAFCFEGLTSNALLQPANLLTAAATQLAWRASVDSMLAATVKYAGVVMYCAAPVYADEPVEKVKRLKCTSTQNQGTHRHFRLLD